MAYIELITEINAPVEQCFNGARNIDLHLNSMQDTNETVIAGVGTGLIGLGETVTWCATHFGLPLKMTIKITELNYATAFVDEQVKGPFKLLKHRHIFRFISPAKTEMVDEFSFASPCGILGKWIDRFILKNYLEKLLIKRNKVLKAFIEKR